MLSLHQSFALKGHDGASEEPIRLESPMWGPEEDLCGCNSLCGGIGIARANSVCNSLSVCGGTLSQRTPCVIQPERISSETCTQEMPSMLR